MLLADREAEAKAVSMVIWTVLGCQWLIRSDAGQCGCSGEGNGVSCGAYGAGFVCG